MAVATLPGEWIADTQPDGTNPGAGYVRFALVPTVAETVAAADRIRTLRFP